MNKVIVINVDKSYGIVDHKMSEGKKGRGIEGTMM